MMAPQLYEKLYTDCYATAYSRALYLLHSHEDAEDAVQAAYITVWKRWPDLEPRGLCSYLLRAVTCRAIEMRRRKQHPTISIEEKQVDAYVMWDVDTMIDLAIAREALSPKLQCAIDLRMEGYTWQEIADMLEISFNCLNKRFYHARVQLRKQVAA